MGYYWLCYNVIIKNYCLIKVSLKDTFCMKGIYDILEHIQLNEPKSKGLRHVPAGLLHYYQRRE